MRLNLLSPSIMLVSSYQSLCPYIRMRRDETGVRLAEHYELLANRWIIRLREDGEARNETRFVDS